MSDDKVDERQRIEAAIAALEAQRPILGDDVVATALAPLRAELDKLTSRPRTRRRQVTIMFADLTGYTTLSEQLDPERVAIMLAGFWRQVDDIIEQHSGKVYAHMADGVLAVWGADVSTETDAERAVDAGLAIVEFVAEQGIVVAGTQIDAHMSIGINTGQAHLVDLESETVVGDSVNVAARLESAAQPGEVLISRSTFGQVRGIYDVEDTGELALKGRSETVRAYRALRKRPRAFPAPSWGVEGIETAMAGRSSEFDRIVERHARTIADREPTSTLVLGEAGIGKSRLLHECRDWLETVNTTRTRYFEGRCHPDFVDQPFALLRSILSNRFEINDNDGPSIALTKLATGVRGLLPDASPSIAGSVAWLIGLSADDEAGDMESSFRRAAATADAVDLLTNLSNDDLPAMLVLEDLHWSDNESLELLETVIDRQPQGLAVLASARDEFRNRRPDWAELGGISPAHDCVALRPLGHQALDDLLDDMLQMAHDIPDELRRIIHEQSDGNPFHAEEIVKMLIDDNVISTDDVWTVDMARLDERRVPTSLTGVLQSRLDRLAPEDFHLLQAASVFGRTFWISGLAELLPGVDIEAAATRLSETELVHREPTSRFDGATEMVFKHDMTRHVTFETIGLDERPPLHASAAAWLASAAGARADEYAVVIARHHDDADQRDHASDWYRRAGNHTKRQGAFADAARWFAMASERCGDPDEQRALAFEIVDVQVSSGQYDEARAHLRLMVDDGEISLEDAKTARAELARIHMLRDGDFAGARVLLEEAVALAGDTKTDADRFVRHQLGNLHIVIGDYPAAVRTFQENIADDGDTAGHRPGWGINSLAHALAQDGQYERAIEVAVDAVELSDRLEDPRLQMATRAQLGLVALFRGDWVGALDWFGEAQDFNRRNGDLEKLATVATYLGEASLELGRVDDAEREFRESATISMRAGIRTELVRAVIGLGGICAERGDADSAMVALATTIAHPSAGGEARRFAAKIADRYALGYNPDDVADLHVVASRLLDDSPVADLTAAPIDIGVP